MSTAAYSRQEIGQTFDVLETPCLILEKFRLMANVARLKRHLHPFGVRLRPHLKTAPDIDVARPAMNGAQGPVTVSTLKEAEYFFSHGVSDLLYAANIAPEQTRSRFRSATARRRLGVQQRTLVQNQSIIWNSTYE